MKWVKTMSDVSKEYGGALFDLACEENIEFDFLGQLRVVDGIVRDNPEYVKFLSAPNIPKSDRLEAVEAAFGGRVHQYICSFLKLLIERGYARYISECVSEFEARYYEYKGLVIAKVQSAVELNDKQKNAILTKLEKITGKEIELRCTVDPQLIGGMKILIGDTLYEGTVRAKLDDLKSRLSATTL